MDLERAMKNPASMFGTPEALSVSSELTAEQKQALKSLARLALGQMELRQNLQLLKEALNDRTEEEHARELELERLQEKLIRVLGLKF